MLAPLGDPEPRILQRKGTYVISFKEWSKIHCFLLKWHPLFTCLTCDDSSPLGSKRPALKTSASSQDAAVTAKAGRGGERGTQALACQNYILGQGWMGETWDFREERTENHRIIES